MLFDNQDHIKIPFRVTQYLDQITDEEAGCVMDDIIEYCTTGKYTELTGKAFDAWLFLKKCADYQEEYPKWRGGLFEGDRAERNSLAYKQWREAVFIRDNYTCQFCGKRGGKINAHHIKRFADYPELRTALANGITLCESCHRAAHRRDSDAEQNYQGINQTQSGD